MKTDERRHRPEAPRAQAKVERTERFDDDLMIGVGFAAVVVLVIVALAMAAV